MKLRILCITGGMAVISLIAIGIVNLPMPSDQVAVAYTGGMLKAFLESSNHPAAYQLMCADFQKSVSLADFQWLDRSRGLADRFSGCRVDSESSVAVRGKRGELRLKYSDSFGTCFVFIKENGQWRFTNKTIGFQSQ